MENLAEAVRIFVIPERRGASADNPRLFRFRCPVRYSTPASFCVGTVNRKQNQGNPVAFQIPESASKQKEKGKNMFVKLWNLSSHKETARSCNRIPASRWIRLSGLLGTCAAVALAGSDAEAGGWLQKTTGIRTPEPIRKIAPNGIQLPKISKHNPPSHVTPNSVFSHRDPRAEHNIRKRSSNVYPANNFSQKSGFPKWPSNSNLWVEQQRSEQERLRLQQQEVQLQQQQLRFQQDAMKAQQKAQVIGSIFQGIGTLIPQERRQISNLPYENGFDCPSVMPLNQVNNTQLQEFDFSPGYEDPSQSEGLFDPSNP